MKRIKKCRYECELCLPEPSSWETKQDYTRHQAEKHGIGENVVHHCPYDGYTRKGKHYTCKGKHYTRKGKLTEHIKNYHSDNPNVFACDHNKCDYACNTRWDLKAHKLTHGKKTMQCTLISTRVGPQGEKAIRQEAGSLQSSLP